MRRFRLVATALALVAGVALASTFVLPIQVARVAVAANRIGNISQDFAAINGVFTGAGVLIATTSVNNHTTATPFSDTGQALTGRTVMVQSDAACWIKVGTTNAVAATTSATGTSLYLPANTEKYIVLDSVTGWIAAIAVSGTANVRVFTMN